MHAEQGEDRRQQEGEVMVVKIGGMELWIELLVSDRKNLDGVKIHKWSLEATRLLTWLCEDDSRVFTLSNEGQLSLILQYMRLKV